MHVMWTAHLPVAHIFPEAQQLRFFARTAAQSKLLPP